MNLIEQLGGYERAKDGLHRLKLEKKDLLTCGDLVVVESEIDAALLQYRRQHNIYEVGDLITHPVFWGLFQVKETMNHHVLGVTSTGYESKLAMELIRHATDEEIKAGKRLELRK